MATNYPLSRGERRGERAGGARGEGECVAG
jgi:hypothetical protein